MERRQLDGISRVNVGWQPALLDISFTFTTLTCMKTTLLTLLAHAGHPGPDNHSSLTHIILGVAVSLPVMIGIGIWMRRRKQAEHAQDIVKPKEG